MECQKKPNFILFVHFPLSEVSSQFLSIKQRFFGTMFVNQFLWQAQGMTTLIKDKWYNFLKEVSDNPCFDLCQWI